MRFWSKFWKWLKLLNSVPLFKETLVNHVSIRIWSSSLNFEELQWMKTNFKTSQFSRFLLRSEYAIHFKIWKWLKLPNSFPFIKKTLVNHLYIWIWFICLTFTALQSMKTNFKINQFSRFRLRSVYAILVKLWKWLKLLNSVKFIKKILVNHLYIWIWSSGMNFAALLWMKTNFKISQFKNFCLGPGKRFCSKLEND